MNYLTDPKGIENLSMEIIDSHLPDLKLLPEGEAKIIRRIVHTTGDPSCAQFVKIHPKAVEAGLKAIRSGCKVITDVNMLKAGINGNLAGKFGVETSCLIKDPRVVEKAKETGLTRAMVSMEVVGEELNGAIVAIGNAPTALFKLCQFIKEGKVKPALVVGTPVGFVGAKESKDVLLEMDIPYVTVVGTRGGSTIAASVVNALLLLA